MKIFAVVVTFNPQLDALLRLLNALNPQVSAVVVVDNASGNRHEFIQLCGHRILFESNRGLGSAHNAGIDYAKAAGATHVVLFDQDSEPLPDMVFQLFEVMASRLKAGYKVASVGPCYEDPRRAIPPPFLRIENGKLKRLVCDHADESPEVDYLISSGCLIPMEAVKACGGMNEALFVDYVDIEWGLRANALGWQSFGSCLAKMKHHLGDKPIEFLGRHYPSHSPLRHYYHFRNAMWLYRHSPVSRQWKLVDSRRLVLRFAFYALFAKPRLSHLSMMLQGLWHGAQGKLGKRNASN